MLRARMGDQRQVMGWGCGSGVAGWTDLWLNWLFSQTDLLAKWTFSPNRLFGQRGCWLTQFQARFNQHCSRKIVYSSFFTPKAFNLVFTENRWIDSSVVQDFRKRLLQKLQNEPPYELHDNLTRITLKILVTNSWQRILHRSMHSLEAETGNVQGLHV